MVETNQLSSLFLLSNPDLFPVEPKISWGLSSVGRASDLHSEGQEFESPNLQ